MNVASARTGKASNAAMGFMLVRARDSTAGKVEESWRKGYNLMRAAGRQKILNASVALYVNVYHQELLTRALISAESPTCSSM